MSDKFFSQVMVLAGFNGADAATAFTEESAVARVATFVGNAQLDTAQFKWETASLLLDGAGDTLTFPDAADLTLGTSDFTIECWQRMRIFPAAASAFVSHYNSTSNQRGWLFDYLPTGGPTGNDLRFAYSTLGTAASLVQVTTPWTPVHSTWYHMAASRNTTNLRLYINGALQITHNIGASSIFNTTSTWAVGSLDGVVEPFDGWIDEVRFTVGLGRYPAAFVPPQGPFSRGKWLGVAGQGRAPILASIG